VDGSFLTDLQVVKELRGYSDAALAQGIGVSSMTLFRWRKNPKQISQEHVKQFYAFAYREGIRLNRIKEQLLREDCAAAGTTVLFHGAKTEISGELSLKKSKANNDFGTGIYCGESFEQAAMFVCNYPDSSVYVMEFANRDDLRSRQYQVDQDWMLTIAYNRGRIAQYADTPKIQNLIRDLQECDYVIAPIADNRMFQLIDEFIDGEITDVQCQHALSATNLGMQVVFLREKALERVKLLNRCFLAEAEKNDYLTGRQEENRIGIDKAKVAKREYRGQGQYIDQILI